MSSAAPSYSEFVAAIRGEGESLIAAASLGLDEWVPTCKEWNVEALVDHISRVYNNTVQLLSRRITSRPTERYELPSGEPLDVLRETLDELVEQLSEADPDTEVWNWAAGEPQVAMFWARRMAHESSMHRFDAQMAHSIAQPIDAELAHDGVDELIDIISARIYRRDSVEGPTGTVALNSSDDGSWLFSLEDKGLSRLDVLSQPDVSARGTTSGLLLASYGRVPWSSQDVTGDVTVLDSWSEAMNF